MKVNGLIKYPPFCLLFLAGLLIVGTSGIALYFEEVRAYGLVFCGTKQCFLNFKEIYSFPIEVAKATAALLAIVALLHKSDETQKQISISEDQNKFSNYYKHKEEFKKHISESYENGESCDIGFLHKKIFPNSINGDYRLSDTSRLELIEYIKDFKSKLIRLTRYVFTNDVDGGMIKTKVRQYKLDRIYEYFHYKGYREPFKNLDDNALYFQIVDEYVVFLKSTTKIFSLIKLVVSFDHANDGVLNLDEFLYSMNEEKFNSYIDSFFEEIKVADARNGYYTIDDGTFPKNLIAYNFIKIIDKYIDLSILMNNTQSDISSTR